MNIKALLESSLFIARAYRGMCVRHAGGIPDGLQEDIWSLEAALRELPEGNVVEECDKILSKPSGDPDLDRAEAWANSRRFHADAVRDRIIMAARRSAHLTEPKLVRVRERLALYLDGKLPNHSLDDVIADLGALEHALEQNPDRETAQAETRARIAEDARSLGDQWIEECLYGLNLKIVLGEISEGERQVLAGILKQVRAGRGA